MLAVEQVAQRPAVRGRTQSAHGPQMPTDPHLIVGALLLELRCAHLLERRPRQDLRAGYGTGALRNCGDANRT